MAANAGRSGRRWRRLREELRRQRRPCCICKREIDYTLAWPDPESFSVEHRKPWSTNPEAREDPANLDAAHLGCNSGSGRKTRTQVDLERQLGQRSQAW